VRNEWPNRLRSWVANESQEPDPAATITAAAAEIERLLTVIDAYAASSAAACREIASLRESRDLWIARSNDHAMRADRHRTEIVNLKGTLWQMEISARESRADS
jgi:hypothetical protein